MSRLVYFTIIFLLLFSASYKARSQCPPATAAPATEWTHRFSGGGFAPTSQQTPDGGYLNVSSTDGIGTSYSLSVVKTGPDGRQVWQNYFTAGESDNPHSVALTTDGGCVVSGTTSANGVPGGNGNQDGFITKLNASGIKEWTRFYGGTGRDEIYSAEQTADGGYIMAGFTEAGNDGTLAIQGYLDYWIVKLDSQGNVQWQKAYGGNNEDDAFCIHQTKDKGYIVAGRTYSTDGIAAASGGYCDAMILKLDAAGNLTWTTLYGGKAQDRATSVRETTDGGYIVGGNENYDESQTPVLYGKNMLLKLTAGGTKEWQTVVQGSAQDDSYWADATETADGGYILAANVASATGGPFDEFYYDAYLAKTNASGTLLWEKTYGEVNTYDVATGIIVTADGGYAITGWSFSRGSDNITTRDSWLMKLAPDIAKKPAIDSIHITPSCFGIPTGTIHIFTRGVSALQYTLSGVNSNGEGSFTNLASGNYTITVAGTPGCDTTTNIVIEKIAAPQIMLSSAVPSCKAASDGSVSVKTEGIETPYLFSFNHRSFDGINRYTNLGAGSYPLSVKDKNGCLSDTVAVVPSSEKNCNVAVPPVTDSVVSVSIPSAFTPNKDSRNDWFKPVVRGSTSSFHFFVYNRLGQVIYEGHDGEKGWDGTEKGIAQPAGVYLYHLTWKTSSNKYGEKNGTITLIR